MTRMLLVVLAVLLSHAGLPTPASAGPVADTVSVTIDPQKRSLDLGDDLAVQVNLRNEGTQASVPLVVHLDVVDPSRSTSVDPEDWTSTLVKRVGTVAAGDTAAVDWRIQPISAGRFTVYAVAVSDDGAELAASDVLAVDVADRRSLDPGGILPVAIGEPVLVGALLLLQVRLARRSRHRNRQVRS